MWGKIVAGAGAVFAFALIAILGHQLVVAYGDARAAAGRAAAEAARLPALLAEHDAAEDAESAARDKIIAAQQISALELGRILPLLLEANDKVNSYAQTDAGRAPCLPANRVHGIEADRAALFPASGEAGSDDAGSMPPDGITDAAGPQPR